MPEKETLEKLYRKYLNNEITMEELEEFLQELDSDNGELIVSKLMDGTWEEMYETDRSKVIPIGKRKWFRIAAAAVVLLFLAAGSYLLLNKPVQNAIVKKQTTQPSNDIQPGGNKAILTLADGTRVILDSANNGTITKQGNVTIIKLNDGQLSYQPSTLNSQSSTADSRLPTVLYNTISTPRGGQYQLVLADGSKVWLNAASSIRFPNAFPGNDRKVEITGEAYFEVARNAAKPFYVEAGGMEVKVLGTHFNVNAYADEPAVKTTLLEGSVRVTKGSESKTITPGEQAGIENGGNATIKISNVDVNEVVAWKNGLFHFNNSSLKEVMRQLSRWYDIDVEYADGIEPRRFGGEMARSSDLNQVLKILEESKVHFEIVGKKLLVKP